MLMILTIFIPLTGTVATTLQTLFSCDCYNPPYPCHRKHCPCIMPKRKLRKGRGQGPYPESPPGKGQIQGKGQAILSCCPFLESIIIPQNKYIGNKKWGGQLILNYHFVLCRKRLVSDNLRPLTWHKGKGLPESQEASYPPQGDNRPFSLAYSAA